MTHDFHDSQDDPNFEGDPRGTPRRQSPGRNRGVKRSAVVLGVLVLAAMSFIFYKGLTSALVYFYTAQQAIDNKGSLGTSVFKMEGVVVPGSIQSTNLGVDFSVQFNRTVVPVVEVGVPPQLFQPSVPVVVVGHFSSTQSNEFLSNKIMIKHSSNYVAAHPNRIKNPGGAS